MKSIGILVGHMALGAFAGAIIGGAVSGLVLWFEPAPRGDTPDLRGLALLLYVSFGAAVGAPGGLLFGCASLLARNWSAPHRRGRSSP